MQDASLAGYRVVRRLGSGSRADVYLGHAGTEPPRIAALKVFHPVTPLESIDSELRALTAASHAHVVQLRDVSSIGDGRPVLVMERLEPRSLGQLLASRGVLGAGEAVTILAPIAAAAGALHESGVQHNALTASRVLFRESGAPVLAGFGHASHGLSGGDNRDLVALMAAVLDRVPEANALRSWLGSLAAFPDTLIEQLSSRLFDLAEATPVRFDVDLPHAELVPARATPVPTAVVELPERLEPVETPTSTSRLRALIAPYLARIPERFRRPHYAAVAAGALALVVAIAVVPGGGQAQADLTPTAAPTAVEAGPVVNDDPVAAFAALVRVRNDCIRDLSILCLDAALQPDSAAMDDDVALIRSIERGDGGDAVLEVSHAALVERMGDAALISYGSDSAPASALLVKGESGWRIRSYLLG